MATHRLMMRTFVRMLVIMGSKTPRPTKGSKKPLRKVIYYRASTDTTMRLLPAPVFYNGKEVPHTSWVLRS